MKLKFSPLAIISKLSETITFFRALMSFVVGKGVELAGSFLIHLAEIGASKLLGLIGHLKEIMEVPILGKFVGKAVKFCIENLETLLPVLAKVALFGTIVTVCGKALAIVGPILLAVRLGKIGVRTLESWGIDVRSAFARGVAGIKQKIANAFAWAKGRVQLWVGGTKAATQALFEEVRHACTASDAGTLRLACVVA